MRRCYGRRISPAYRKSHTRRQQSAPLTGGVSSRKPARTTRHIRIRRIRLAGLLVVIAAIAAAQDDQPRASSPWTADAPIEVLRRGQHGAPGDAHDPVPTSRRSSVTIRGTAGLDRALAGALRRAATDAADDGIEFYVKSGRRSPADQDQLFREAVAKYGSAQEAARWVATPDKSLHVSGDAVDIGPSGATAWLAGHGAAYGLCQIYANEPWHYELRPEAIDQGCPPVYADPTHDPRMQQP